MRMWPFLGRIWPLINKNTSQVKRKYYTLIKNIEVKVLNLGIHQSIIVFEVFKN